MMAIKTASESGRSQPGASQSVGLRVRQLREARNLTLREVSERADLSINAISRIERGETSPTVNSLERIAQALQVPLCDFFTASRRNHTIHTSPYTRENDPAIGIKIDNLGAGLPFRALEAFIVTVKPGCGTRSDPAEHPGQEFVYCLEGRLRYQVGETTYVLQAGHSLLFEASQPHSFSNSEKDATAKFLLIFQTGTNTNTHHNNHV